METFVYYLVIFLVLCVLAIVILIIEYFRPFFLDWLLKKEIRLFTFLSLSLFSVSSYSTYFLLIKPSNDYFDILINIIVIVFSTIACFFIFFKLRKPKFNQNKIRPSVIKLEEIAISNQNSVNFKDEEVGEKLINQKTRHIINYNSSFSTNQLSYLYREFKKYQIIEEDCLEKDFVNKFLIEQFMIKMEAISLYHLHIEISKIITQKITLKFFVTLFKDKKNNIYGYNSVKLGVKYENHKLAHTFKNIFERFPK